MSTILEREIREQPEIIAGALGSSAAAVDELASETRRREVIYVLIAARGTSDNAGIYAKYLLSAFNGLPVAMTTPSLYTYYGAPPRLRNVLVLGISQSGQSEDILSVIENARSQGALTAVMTNDPASPLGRAAQHVLPLCAGAERAVAATKTYTASLALLARLSAALAGDTERMAALEELPRMVASAIEAADPVVREKAERYRYMERCVVISRGYNYATAFETSLKMKELTYVTAEPYSSADFMHGPMAMVEAGFPVFLIAVKGALLPHLLEFASQLRERKAEIIAVSNSPEVLGSAQSAFPIPQGIPEWLSPIPSVIPGQLFALRLAVAKGIDPDAPRGLRKVTITR